MSARNCAFHEARFSSPCRIAASRAIVASASHSLCVSSRRKSRAPNVSANRRSRAASPPSPAASNARTSKALGGGGSSGPSNTIAPTPRFRSRRDRSGAFGSQKSLRNRTPIMRAPAASSPSHTTRCGFERSAEMSSWRNDFSSTSRAIRASASPACCAATSTMMRYRPVRAISTDVRSVPFVESHARPSYVPPCPRRSKRSGATTARRGRSSGTASAAIASATSKYFSSKSGGSASVSPVVSKPSPISSAGSMRSTIAPAASTPKTSRTEPAYCARFSRRTFGTSRVVGATTASIAATAAAYSSRVGRISSSAGGISRLASRLRSARNGASPIWFRSSAGARSSPPLPRGPS